MFNHEEHMAKMEQGLQHILQSQDINEAHQIAQGLLGEEETEEQEMPTNPETESSEDGSAPVMPGKGDGKGFRDKIAILIGKGKK